MATIITRQLKLRLPLKLQQLLTQVLLLSQAADPVTVKLQLKWVPQAGSAGYFVAQDKGYYKEEGLDVEILPGGPDIVPEQQVAGGSADIGVGWVASLLPSLEEGMPLVQIAQIYQKSGLVLVSKKLLALTQPLILRVKKSATGWVATNLNY